MTIYDGRESFYQWDLNQKVTSDDFQIGDKIHFYSMRHPTALATKAYVLDGKVVADVPNILLQTTNPIKIYRYISNSTSAQTVDEQTFVVKQKPQPSDYFYTETELYELRSDVERAVEDANNAEQARQRAETNRVDAEALRFANEELRKISETNRVDAESKRVTAENLRVEAESKRVTAETSRVTAEQNRVDAETSRQLAEQDRQSAETLRQTTFEQSYNNVANALKGSVSGEVIRVDDVSPIEHLVKAKARGKNLFNTGAIDVITDDGGDLYVSAVGEGTITITSSENYVGNGFTGINRTLRELCPQIIAGKEYVLSAVSPSNTKAIFLVGKSVVWQFGTSKVLTEDLINCRVVFYGYDSTIYGHGDCIITNIQIEEGTVATEYTPYVDPTTMIVTRFANNLFDESLLPYEKTTINGVECYNLVHSATSDYIHINSGKRPVTISYFARSDSGSATIEITDYDGNIHYQASYSIDGFGYRKNTIQNGIKYLRFLNWGQAYAYGFVINLGDTAIDYEPYNGTFYTPSLNGTVDVVSISPTMTLLTDTAGVTIEAEYNRDANLVIADMQSQIDNLKTLITGLQNN